MAASQYFILIKNEIANKERTTIMNYSNSSSFMFRSQSIEVNRGDVFRYQFFDVAVKFVKLFDVLIVSPKAEVVGIDKMVGKPVVCVLIVSDVITLILKMYAQIIYIIVPLFVGRNFIRENKKSKNIL